MADLWGNPVKTGHVVTSCPSQVSAAPETTSRGSFLVVLWGWLAIVAVGFCLMLQQEFGAHPPSRAPDHWPASASISRLQNVPTLVISIHPSCPCSRASWEQLERLLAQTTQPLQVVALMFSAPELDDLRVGNGIRQRAAKNSRVQLLSDPRARIAEAFGLQTSGEVAFYDESGTLRFQGGLTAARGYSAPSRGWGALHQWLQPHAPETTTALAQQTSPAFGCSLEELP